MKRAALESSEGGQLTNGLKVPKIEDADHADGHSNEEVGAQCIVAEFAAACGAQLRKLCPLPEGFSTGRQQAG